MPDPSTAYRLNPREGTINVQKNEKFGRGRAYVGRYAPEGNILRWVPNSRGKKRPADLEHRPERDQFLMVLERQR